jgi:hypothetical protein
MIYYLAPPMKYHLEPSIKFFLEPRMKCYLEPKDDLLPGVLLETYNEVPPGT